ncbi:Translation initiation factor 2B subunit, eIF-2B alpha/beta/delta family [Natronoarchaeum philippinense]|uniref:Translation initiation factor 2B subunit, eIF-2B alpha/beta/delta family n=1 Tax=Natronoarchaeum philippinense TaxID=558529 RepID=A0A285NX03_NATPI|nr:initiation factor 2B [Natronoarchaeum philippinense]SNZ12416.1 Translation initiation factor 2B subunit, eIF-2B alpha/beta/delta family [Natronoarchaeum philippinense]
MTDYATPVVRRGAAVCVSREDDRLQLPIARLDDADDPVEIAADAVASTDADLEPVRTGTAVPDGEDSYVPVLFDAPADLDAPADAERLAPTALLHEAEQPTWWRCYERVAPTVRSITADDEHGAAVLSTRALEVLRDRAALQIAEGDPDRGELTDLAERLLSARPSMAVLENRVNRALAAAVDDANETADGDDETPAAGIAAAVEAAADTGIDRAIQVDADTAAAAAGMLDGATVLTLSRSGTVLDALSSASLDGVYVAESRPAREGIGVAEELSASIGAPVTVHADAAVAHVVAHEGVDAVVVGADAVLPDGRVVNKTGTRAAALSAAREDIPVYAVAASDKITHRETVNIETGDAGAIYDGPADLDVLNPTFDVTPADLIDAVVTERGRLDADEVGAVAEDHAELTSWRE